MRSALVLSTLLVFPTLSLQAEIKKNTEEQSALPAMKVLPIGSSLHDIRAPRFDENYNQTSLLTAERMDILSAHQLKGSDVNLTLFKNNAVQATTHLQSVYYFESAGVIHSEDNLTISGDSLDIASQGLTLKWEKRAGFLLGKTQTILYSDRDQKMTSSVNNKQSSKPTPNSRAKSKAKTAAVLASIPSLLTAEELQQIDKLAEPSTALIQQIDQQSQLESQNVEQRAFGIDHQKNILRTELTTVVGQTTSATTSSKILEPKQDTNKVPVTITSDDGMYFDSTKGLIVYSKNVSVTHPQYQLSCSDELKVQLKETTEQSEAETTNDATTADSKEPNTGNLSRFTGVDLAIATGDVVIRAKDNKGRLITAKANTITYNGETGVTILKGGRPTITQGDTIARILSDSGYIKILPNMSTRIVGAHEIKTNLKKLQGNQQ